MKKEVKPKNIYLKIFPKGKTAITIYPYILWSKKHRGWEKISFVKHERYHWDEQREWKENKFLGLLQWLTIYFAEWFWFNIIKGLPADRHPMEKPAYEAGLKE